MTRVVLFLLLGLSCVFFSCKGQIILPPGGNSLTILNGSTEKIEWSIDPSVDPTAIVYRSWTFKSSRGGKDEFLGSISQPGDITVSTKLYEVEIKTPATLVLKNVDASYNGTYEFTLLSPGSSKSEVVVIIPVKPNPMIINCSDPTTVNEGDDLACECRDEEGKPQANLTWYDKDGVQIGDTSYGENILTLINVTKQDSGRYTCKAQSYILTDEESFELIVRLNFRPNQTDVIFTKNPAVLGGSVTVMCSSNGLPEPSYTIMHNSITVSNQSTYIIREVKSRDAGTYKCIATNKLGSDSDSKNLTVEQGPTTQPSPSSTPTSTTKKSSNGTVTTPDDGEGKGGLSTGAIIGIIIGVLLLLVIIGIVVYCCKSKEKDGRNRGNIDPVPGNHYELENEEPVPGDGAYDTVGPVGASGSKSKPPAGNTLPPVYAAVDKNNRQGNTLYASLDTEALQTSRASKKEPDRPPQAEYASIDFGKSAPKADLV